jgi:hypothetical protein
MTEDEIRNLFREMRDEPIPPDSIVRVRDAVAGRIESGSWVSRFHGWWRIAGVLLAAASIVAVLLFMRPSTAVDEPAPGIAARQPETPFERTVPPERSAPTPVNVIRGAKHPARRATQRPVRRLETPAAGDGVLIRIETPDPNVVIVLVGD